jgi:hypothetical protein
MNTVMSEEQIKEAGFQEHLLVKSYKYYQVLLIEGKKVAEKQDAFTRSELAKAVREIENPNPKELPTSILGDFPATRGNPEYYAFEVCREAVLKVVEGTK